MSLERKLLEERAGVYSLLRSLYTYPLTAEKLWVIAHLDIPIPLLDAPLDIMRNRVREVIIEDGGIEGGVHLRDLINVLNVEMTRLFEGPGTPAAPPYASYYLNARRLMGPEAIAVRRFYVTWNVIPVDGMNIPADHIALELGFLAYLAQQALTGFEAERMAVLQASFDFIKHHLEPWLPSFLNALSTATQDLFFAALADLTRLTVKQDRLRLQKALTSKPSTA